MLHGHAKPRARGISVNAQRHLLNVLRGLDCVRDCLVTAGLILSVSLGRVLGSYA